MAVAIYLCQLAFAIHNTYAFLYKQGKYKTLPLLVFYILTYLLTIFRIFTSIFTIGSSFEKYIILNFGCPWLKLNMGINQCWMLIELAIGVHLSLKLSSSSEEDLPEI